MSKDTEAVACKYCKKMPHIQRVDGDIYYTQCQCGKWSPYQFMGATPRTAIESWNEYNKIGVKAPKTIFF